MKVKRRMRGVWKVSAVLTALVLVVSGVAMFGYSGTMWKNGIGEGGEKGVIPLMPPPFIQIAGASSVEGGSAFPEDEAGISAYVNVGESIDLEKVATIFDQIENVSETHVVGFVPISNYGGNVRPHLYADTSGWIVAYFTKDEPASLIMDWQNNNKGDLDNPKIEEIKTTTLEQAIKKTCDAIGIDYEEIKQKIKYYDFEFPEADSMLLFVKTRADRGKSYVHLSVPDNYKVYEASYYLYATNSGYIWARLEVDGKRIDSIENGRDVGLYDTEKVLTVGQAHTIAVEFGGYTDHGSAGVATVLIYKSP